MFKLSATLLLLAVHHLTQVLCIGELGFNLPATDNNGNCKTTDDWVSDLETVKTYGSSVKIYAVSDCNALQTLGPAAEQVGSVKLWLGIWEVDDAHFEAEQNALSTYLPEIDSSLVNGFLVGSEALYRGDLSPSALAGKIQTIQKLVSNINDKNGKSYSGFPVGTVDSWNMFVNGTNAPAIEAADMIMVNAFPYWQGQDAANASYSFVDDIMQAVQSIQSIKGTDFWIEVGETGHPTSGTTLQGKDGMSSVPSVDNAETLWQTGICALRAYGISVNVFEAFDEPWKPLATADTGQVSDVERHWGVWDSNGSLKYNITCGFD
ncbi:hypothetical protein ACO0QE_001631 [Hanseniaspora vineae]